MIRQVCFTLLLLAVVGAPATAQRTCYSDPEHGSCTDPGTAERPWGSLAEIVESGRLRELRGGDELLLRSGFHGAVSFDGDNEVPVTIRAQDGHAPRLSRLEIRKGSNWVVRGLRISSSFCADDYSGSLVVVGERGPTRAVTIEDCFVFGAPDSSEWTVEDWVSCNSGMFMGRHGTNLTCRNNYVLNTRFGISLCAPASLCEGNVVAGFSGDGVRITRDDITVQYNVIKNSCCGDADGDPNHDDAIQCFLFNKGKGTVRRAVVRGNLVVNREDDRQQFPCPLQAIGFFDGPLIDFVVEGNVICTSHWHGVSLYDAQNCQILDNAVYTRWTDVRLRPWVMLGQKEGLARGNTVRGNLAHSFRFDADPEVKSADNEPVTRQSFERRFEQLRAEIDRRFGKRHPVADRPRVELAWQL